MDNSKTLSDSILELKNSSKISDSTDILEQTVSSGSGMFGWVQNISYFYWFLFILFLTFLGFNIFTYLAEGSEEIKSVFAPILKQLFGYTIVTTSKTVDVAAEGGKAVVSGTATGVNKGLTALQSVTPNSVSDTSKSNLENVFKKKSNTQNNDFMPHEASSSIYKGKAGWCFIGEDRGHRSCIKVSENDKCMSGDIFPTQAVCINPNLRV